MDFLKALLFTSLLYSKTLCCFSLPARRNRVFIHHSSPNIIRFYSAPPILPASSHRGIAWCSWTFNPSFNNWKRRIYIKPRFQASLEHGKLWCLGYILLHASHGRGDVVAVTWRARRDSFYICLLTLPTTCPSLLLWAFSAQILLYLENLNQTEVLNLKLPAMVSMMM